MKILKNLFIFSFITFGLYTLVMYFLDDKKVFEYQYELNFPNEKVYNQFYDLRNFSDWNPYFDTKNDETKYLQFFSPYKGIGSSLKMVNKKDSLKQVEIFIRKALPSKNLRYDLFSSKTSDPYRINIKFTAIQPNKTKVFWRIETPIIPYYGRVMNFFTTDFISKQIAQSMQNLQSHLSDKIDKNIDINTLKTDSIFVENSKNIYLVGVEESTGIKKGELYKLILSSHTKIFEYITRVLDKKEDEIGYPNLIFDEKNESPKSIKFFYGIPLNTKASNFDASYKTRLENPQKQYSIYYKGNYEARQGARKQLVTKAEKDSVRHGTITETFLQSPKANQESVLKISLQILD